MAAVARVDASSPPGQRFVTRCIGHTDKSLRVEYVFRVRHIGGCEWTVQKRYQELSDLHDRLCAVFGAQGLPAFPPKPGGGGIVGALLGVPGSRREDVAADREAAFQKYFDALCGRDDVVRTACFQAALAVLEPEPVGHLRVRGWLPALAPAKAERALLDVRSEGQCMESSAVVEAYHVVARATNGDAADDSEAKVIADFQVPVKGGVSGETLQVDGLPAGVQAHVEVSTVNALASSQPVSIRFLVPAERSVEVQRRHVEDIETERHKLAERRLELEQWMAERQREAEKADAERIRQLEDFRNERAALEREKEDLLQRNFTPQESAGGASSSCSPRASPQMSPRAMVATEEAIESWNKLQSTQEELARQLEELQAQREQQRLEAENAAKEANSRQAELENQLSRREAELITLRLEREASKELSESQAELERQRQELDRRRQEQAAEAKRASEESARLAAEAEAQRAELERRSKELQALEAEREKTVERSEREQKKATEDLQRQKEELQRLLQEQREAAETAEADCAQRAAALEAQQELLKKQRLEVESKSAAEEAERESRLNMLSEQQEALERERELLQKDREQEKKNRDKQAADIELQEKELRRKDVQLSRKEELLAHEREELSRSRASLALVQAHVMNLLESSDTSETKTMRLDDSDRTGEKSACRTFGTEDSDDEVVTPRKGGLPRNLSDDVYSMDWNTAVQGKHRAHTGTMVGKKDSEAEDLNALQEEEEEGA